jgi:hypothetical protein
MEFAAFWEEVKVEIKIAKEPLNTMDIFGEELESKTSHFHETLNNGLRKVDCSILKTGQGNKVHYTELVGHIEEIVTKEDMPYNHECLASTWGNINYEKRKATPIPQPPVKLTMLHAPTFDLIPNEANNMVIEGDLGPTPAHHFSLNDDGCLKVGQP